MILKITIIIIIMIARTEQTKSKEFRLKRRLVLSFLLRIFNILLLQK